jgi:hypothetical protein
LHTHGAVDLAQLILLCSGFVAGYQKGYKKNEKNGGSCLRFHNMCLKA